MYLRKQAVPAHYLWPLGDLCVMGDGLGVSRLKDGKLIGIAPLSGTEIQVVQQDNS
jgi:hypothetical protein